MFLGIVPVRVSFAGGGTDLPEFYYANGGCVVTTAINLFTYTVIHPRQDDTFQAFSPDFQKHYKPMKYENIEIQDGTQIASSVIKFFEYKKGVNVILFSDVPAGTGLGSSSSLTVNLVNIITYLKREKFTNEKIAETAFQIGRDILKWPIGKQDEYVSAFGGFNYIKFQQENVEVIPIRLNKSSLEELQLNLLLFNEGNSRSSSSILLNQIKMINQKNPDTIESLRNVKELAENMYDFLKKSDITKFGELLNKGWLAKKKFVKGVTNERIDCIYKEALQCGALGGKLTGAGGGGHMLFYCELSKQQHLISKMESLGLKKINFNFYFEKPKIFDSFDLIKTEKLTSN